MTTKTLPFYAGDELHAADLNDPPYALGIVAYGSRPNSNGNVGPVTPSGTARTSVLRVDNITLKASRVYLFHSSDLRIDYGTTTDRGKFELYLNTSGTATTSSTLVARSEQANGDNNQFPQLFRVVIPAADTTNASILLAVSRPTGTGSITVLCGTSDETLWLSVTDLGPAPADTGVVLA